MDRFLKNACGGLLVAGVCADVKSNLSFRSIVRRPCLAGLRLNQYSRRVGSASLRTKAVSRIRPGNRVHVELTLHSVQAIASECLQSFCSREGVCVFTVKYWERFPGWNLESAYALLCVFQELRRKPTRRYDDRCAGSSLLRRSGSSFHEVLSMSGCGR